MTKKRLIELAQSITNIYENISKHKTRPRSLDNTILTKQALTEQLSEYKRIVLTFEHRLKIDDWNAEVKLYNQLKSTYEKSNKILDETPVLETLKPRIKLKTLGKTIILCKRLSSSFNSTLRQRTKLTLKFLSKLIILCGRLTKRSKMPKVDIKLGTSLVAIYDGTPENLSAFLDAIALFSETVDGEFEEATNGQKLAAKELVLKFIKTRLTGTARQTITGAENLEQVLEKLKAQCASKINSSYIKTKLEAIKQKGSLEDFCSNVEKLTLQLATAYIAETIPSAKANQMATKTGVDTLVKGVNNSDTRGILQAGTFQTIHEATQKAQEWDNYKPAQNTQAQAFMARGNFQQSRRGQNSNRGYNSQNRPNHNNWQNNRQQQNWQNNRHQQNWQSNRQNNNYQPNNRFQRGSSNFQRGGRYGVPRYSNNPQQQQMYLANTTMPTQQQLQQPQQGVQMIQPNSNIQPIQQIPIQQIPIQQNNSNFLGGQFGPRIQ